MIKIKLLLVENGQSPRSLVCDLTPGKKILIGRGQNVQLWINDKNISREHSELICENDYLYISDLGSRNGTFVNNKRILEKTRLEDGDEIMLASTTCMKISLEVLNRTSSMTSNDYVVPPQPAQTMDASATYKISNSSSKVVIPDNNIISISQKNEFSLVGEQFKNYRIEERIGVGNVAVVYRATHLTLNRPVAIKTLAQRMLQNKNAVQRFLNVAKVSGQLQHPNIVQIYDSGLLEEYGIYYLAMEYVNGKSIAALLKEQKTMSVETSCSIMEYLAGALSYASKRKIIHRDINPSNILLGPDNVPKLIGLGLSKCLDDELISLTQPGKGMGQVGYISPEQLIDAIKADQRSDIFSLGATFYHMVCGRTPFSLNLREYFKSIQDKIAPEPPIDVNPKIPRMISNIILKMLDFDPDKRYQSAEDLLIDLRAYQSVSQGEGLERARKQLLAMLPTINKIDKFTFEAIYMPMDLIGGDFYDYIPLNDNEFSITIADITGHGVEAAVVVGMVKAFLQVFSKQLIAPSQTLEAVNKELTPNLDKTTFATVFHGIINKKTKKMRFCRAGHNPLLLYNFNREPKLNILDPKNGPVLGMFTRNVSWEEKEIQLQSGDILIQYTDGITEAMNQDREEFGLERMCNVIEQSAPAGNVRQILQDLIQAVQSFKNGLKQEDDITLIGLKMD